MNTHESFRQEEIRASSDRSFGFVFAGFFALVGLAPLWRGGPVRAWALAVSAAFAAVAVLRPSMLGPLNRMWAAFGRLLNKVTNPIVLGILFFGVFTPFAWLTRRFVRDRLRLTLNKQASSYWIVRQPPGPEPESMSRQF